MISLFELCMYIFSKWLHIVVSVKTCYFVIRLFIACYGNYICFWGICWTAYSVLETSLSCSKWRFVSPQNLPISYFCVNQHSGLINYCQNEKAEPRLQKHPAEVFNIYGIPESFVQWLFYHLLISSIRPLGEEVEKPWQRTRWWTWAVSL